MKKWMHESPWWICVLVPVAVYGFALWIFNFGMSGVPDPGVDLKAALAKSAQDQSLMFREAPARLGWLVFAFLYPVVQVAVLAWCLGRMWKQFQVGERLPLFLASGLALFLVGEMLLAESRGSATGRSIFHYTMDCLKAVPFYEGGFLSFVNVVLLFINLISPVGIAFICVTAMSQSCSRDDLSLDELLEKLRILRAVMKAGTVYLVAGVLHMGAWLRWPAALVEQADLQKPFQVVAMSVTGYWGMVFSIVGVFLFLLPIHVVNRRLRQKVAQEDSIENKAVWLKENGIDLDPVRHFQRLAFVLAPLAAVPLGDFLKI